MKYFFVLNSEQLLDLEPSEGYVGSVTGNPKNEFMIKTAPREKSDCASCEALWREHANALIAHLEAVDELELAQFEENVPRSVFLQKVVTFAKRSREETMDAIIAHKISHLTPFVLTSENSVS
jgi:hypothetical protein